MPTYNYKCDKCEIEFSIFQSINDDRLNRCKQCGAYNSIYRIITGGTGMIFKGDGFYITDYSKNKNKSDNKKNNKGKKNE
tara:strand:- start:810 stop:1049 length:240 start_codon:yes stop_codon:yes gene_type:complete